MRHAAAVIALFGLGLASPAWSKCKPADPALAGIYELRGAFEVGSGLQLAPDGQFGYGLTYGAYDEIAKGCWQSDGKTVTLAVTRMRVNHGSRKFRRMVLSADGQGGLIRWEDGRRFGTYERVQRF